MRTITKQALVLMISVFLMGCATGGPKFNEMANQIANTSPNTGRIYLYRSGSMGGAAIQPEVKLNNEVIGRAVPNGFFYVDKEPGNYEVLTSTEVDRKLAMTLDKGQTRYVRFDISMGFFVGHVFPELVDPADGVKEIQDCVYIGGQKP